MKEEADPVVARYKLFLKRRDNDKNPLFVMQNVCLTRDQLEGDMIKSCRIKPKQQKLEVDLALSTNSNSFDRDKADHLARLANGGKEGFFKSQTMDCITYCTPLKSDFGKKFAVGAVHNGEIHLNEVSGILTLKQKLTYMDAADAKAKKHSDDMEEKEEVAEIIAPKFETERSLLTKMKSFPYLQKRLEEEPWTKLVIHGTDSKPSKDDFHNLFSQTRDKSLVDAKVESKEYANMLIMSCGEQSKPIVKQNAHTPLFHLDSMTLQEKVTMLMIKAKILSFDRVLSFLSNDSSLDEGAVLAALRQVATLVQGCWLVSSELIYPKGTISHTGLSSEFLCKSRDYVLWKFSQRRTIVRRDVHLATGLPDGELFNILSQMAEVNSERQWELLLPTDHDFIQKYPDVAAEEAKKWVAKFERIENRGASVGDSPSKTRHRRRTKSQRESDVDEEKEGAASAVVPMEIERTVQDDEEISSGVAETLQAFLEEQLHRQKVCSLSSLRTAMSANVALRKISDKIVMQNLANVGATKLDVQWPPDVRPEPLFCRLELGDDMDEPRKELFNIFKTGTFKHRRSYIKKRLDAVKKSISDFDLALLLKDYCSIGKNGMCYVKGTVNPRDT